MYFVYLHKRPDGSPFYVGKGDKNRAFRLHRKNQHHQNIVAKYGEQSIGIELFPCISEEAAFKLEKRLISKLLLRGEVLCNKTSGGEGISGLRHSLDSRYQMHLHALARGPLSAKSLEKISIANTGKKRTEEQKRTFSLAQQGNTNARGITRSLDNKRAISEGRKGKGLGPLSEEHKIHIGLGLLGRKFSAEHRAKLSRAALKRPRGEHGTFA